MGILRDNPSITNKDVGSGTRYLIGNHVVANTWDHESHLVSEVMMLSTPKILYKEDEAFILDTPSLSLA
jgi:hypothetical protein